MISDYVETQINEDCGKENRFKVSTRDRGRDEVADEVERETAGPAAGFPSAARPHVSFFISSNTPT